MTKADIVDRVHEAVGCTKKDSYDIVEQLFDVIKETLEAGEKSTGNPRKERYSNLAPSLQPQPTK